MLEVFIKMTFLEDIREIVFFYFQSSIVNKLLEEFEEPKPYDAQRVKLYLSLIGEVSKTLDRSKRIVMPETDTSKWISYGYEFNPFYRVHPFTRLDGHTGKPKRYIHIHVIN